MGREQRPTNQGDAPALRTGFAAVSANGRRLARVRRAAAELTPEAIERIAQRVAELLHRHDRSAHPGLVDAGALARQLGVTRSWVYEHARELGAIRIGSGPRARLRFDLERALASLNGQRSRQDPWARQLDGGGRGHAGAAGTARRCRFFRPRLIRTGSRDRVLALARGWLRWEGTRRVRWSCSRAHVGACLRFGFAPMVAGNT